MLHLFAGAHLDQFPLFFKNKKIKNKEKLCVSGTHFLYERVKKLKLYCIYFKLF